MPGFFIAYSDSTGARDPLTEVELSPRPARVIYPEESRATMIETTGGSVVVQYQSQDPRTRTWQWENYPADYAAYMTLWSIIQPLASRYRKLAGDQTPYVWLKEDMTGLLGKVSVSGVTVTPTYDWLRCRVTSVLRPTLQDGTSLVRYAATKLVFIVEDPDFVAD
jgi:hypothetical protein